MTNDEKPPKVIINVRSSPGSGGVGGIGAGSGQPGGMGDQLGEVLWAWTIEQDLALESLLFIILAVQGGWFDQADRWETSRRYWLGVFNDHPKTRSYYGVRGRLEP